MPLTAAIKEAYASCPSDVVLIETVELYHPEWQTVIRMVRGKDGVTAGLESNAPNNPGASVYFEPLDFNLSQPRIGEGRQELTLDVDNTSLFLIPLIESHDLSSLQEARVIYRPYISTDLSGPHMNPPLSLSIVAISANMKTVSITCGYADIANRKFPHAVYKAAAFPGISYRV